MSIVNEFRKPGGFEQLLSLLEITDKDRREVILAKIELEDSGWASLIRAKMLSAKRISSWSIAIKSQIVLNLDPKPLASLLSTSFKSDIDQLLTAMPEDRAAKVRIFLKSQPQGHEVEAAELELVRVSRQMLSEGKLNIFDIDPTLALNAA